MSETKQTAEDAFRSSVEDCIVLLERLGPLAGSVEELLEILLLGTRNGAQLRLLMARVEAGKAKGTRHGQP